MIWWSELFLYAFGMNATLPKRGPETNCTLISLLVWWWRIFHMSIRMNRSRRGLTDIKESLCWGILADPIDEYHYWMLGTRLVQELFLGEKPLMIWAIKDKWRSTTIITWLVCGMIEMIQSIWSFWIFVIYRRIAFQSTICGWFFKGRGIIKL
jgi:hypothetical protein